MTANGQATEQEKKAIEAATQAMRLCFDAGLDAMFIIRFDKPVHTCLALTQEPGAFLAELCESFEHGGVKYCGIERTPN